ncbi:MAG: hypothetical protein ACJZ2I_11510 [Thalassobaculaceae bacterium]
MRLGITLSIGLHTLVILITWFGFPHLRRDPPLLDQIIFVKVADVAEVTNLPPLSENKKPAPKDKTQPKPPKSKPKAPKTKLNESLKTSQPIPKPIKKTIESNPKPKTPKKTAAPPKVSKPRVKPSPIKPHRKMKQKPKPPQRPVQKKFNSLLKDLKKTKPDGSERKKSLKDRLKEASKSETNKSFNPRKKVTISEIDLVRQQISQCWNITSGARQAEALSVEIEMKMNPDATVRKARVLDSIRMNSDPYYRAAAESALRALSHPDCIPLKFPLDKYKLWKSFIFNFDPKNMLR